MQRIAPMLLAGLIVGSALAQEKVDFDRHDADRDGYLTRAEWDAVKNVAIEFDEADTNRDGRLTEAEVKAAMSIQEEDVRSQPISEPAPVQPVQNADVSTEGQPRNVAMYDVNHDGRVSESEARKDGELVTYFVIWDTNEDGFLNQEEIDKGNRQADDNTRGYASPESQSDDRERAPGAGETSERRQTRFEAYDTNVDGFIDANETAGDEYLEANFDTWDVNDDDRLDATEVDDTWSEWDADSFDTYDVNDDGLLDENEAAEHGYINYNFDTWDVDRNGAISEDEADTGWLDDNDDGVRDEDDW